MIHNIYMHFDRNEMFFVDLNFKQCLLIRILKLLFDHDFHFVKINVKSKSPKLYTLECFFTFFLPKAQQTVCFKLDSNMSS